MISKSRRKNITAITTAANPPKKKRGPKPRPIVEFPEPNSIIWADRDIFHEALALHIERHGETAWHLHKAIVKPRDRIDRKTIVHWVAGTKLPRSTNSHEVLRRIEKRYRLPAGYFAAKLPHTGRAADGHTKLDDMGAAERRRMAWHLPVDFDKRLPKERREILDWVRKFIISGATDYRRYQAMAMRQRYAIRFPDLSKIDARVPLEVVEELEPDELDDVELELVSTVRDAPKALAEEVAHLIQFKTATLTEIGYQRNGVWNDQTALQKVDHLGLLFGALAASPDGEVAGFGVALPKLTVALLVFPAIWDWYVRWRERRRGFFTIWEVNMVQLGLAMTRAETGWLRQRPDLAVRLRPIPGLISEADIEAARSDWDAVCDTFYAHGIVRAKVT